MKKILVVVDMQNDFITGPLGTREAVAIVDKVCEKIRGEGWDAIVATMDTHYTDYFNTQEGKKLPVEHCIYRSHGWCLNPNIADELSGKYISFCKSTFGCMGLMELMDHEINDHFEPENEFELTLVGVCTDICVISNALLLKAHYPEMRIVVDASCCAGSTPFRHREALDILRSCQVEIVNDINTVNFLEKHFVMPESEE